VNYIESSNTVIVGFEGIIGRVAEHSTAVYRSSQAAPRRSTWYGQVIHAVWITWFFWLATTAGVSCKAFCVWH